MVTGTLADMIEAQYHSMGSLTEKLSAASVGVQGSGWGWLGYDKVNKRLAIATCANQVRARAHICLVICLRNRVQTCIDRPVLPRALNISSALPTTRYC